MKLGYRAAELRAQQEKISKTKHRNSAPHPELKLWLSVWRAGGQELQGLASGQRGSNPRSTRATWVTSSQWLNLRLSATSQPPQPHVYVKHLVQYLTVKGLMNYHNYCFQD